MKVVAVLLAAGAGRRIGGCKALLAPGGRSFLERCASRLSVPGVSGVVAVTGADGEAVARAAADLAGVECVANPRADRGMLESLRVGLDRAEARGADAVLVHPVDHPEVAEATVVRVVAALGAGATIAVPSVGGRRGHPGGFAAAVWPDLRRASPERGAREVLSRRAREVVHVEGDPGCRTGIDTPGDFRRVFGGEAEWLSRGR